MTPEQEKAFIALLETVRIFMFFGTLLGGFSVTARARTLRRAQEYAR